MSVNYLFRQSKKHQPRANDKNCPKLSRVKYDVNHYNQGHRQTKNENVRVMMPNVA